MFYIVYVLTPEMFPTLVRQATTSMCSATCRLASMVLPLFMYSGTSNVIKLFTYTCAFHMKNQLEVIPYRPPPSL